MMQRLRPALQSVTAIIMVMLLIGRSRLPLPVYASGPTVPPGATLGTVIATGTIPGTSSSGVSITGLTPGNWYAIESSGGPVNVLFGTGPNTCTIAIRDSAGGPWFSRDSWTASTWVSQHDDLGQCATETNPWYSYSRFWFVANSTDLSVRVYDGAWVDNTGSLDFTVYAVNLLDTVAPATTATITCTLGLNSWCLDEATIALSAVDSGNPSSGVQATYYSSSLYTSPNLVTAEGLTNFTYSSTDNAGNVEAVQNGSVQIDTQSPATTCSPSGILGSNGWYRSNVIYTCTSTDLTSGLATITFDGVPYIDPVSVSTPGLGTHTFFASDNAGNVESAQSTAVSIDTDLPTGTLTFPTDGQSVNGTTTLTGTAADSTSGIATVEVSTDGGATWHVAIYSGTSWSFDWDTTGGSDGVYTLESRATDLAGNQQVFSTLNLNITNTPPSAAIELTCRVPGDHGWCRAPLTVGLFGTPGGSPVVRLDYERDGQSLSAVGDHLLYEENVNGEHHVQVQAVDSLGRQSLSLTQTFRIDQSAPTGQFNGYGDNALALNIADEGSGVGQWTAQVFAGSGQSVFYKEGPGSFSGRLNWPAAPGIYLVELFVRDVAGNEFHLPRTAFAIAAPSPALVLEQVLGVFTPTSTALPTTLSPTVTSSPVSIGRPTTIAALVPTAIPTALAPATPGPIVFEPPVKDVVATSHQPPIRMPSLGWLSLLVLLGLMLSWLLSAALDRRAGAVWSLAAELEALVQVRTYGPRDL